MKIIIPGPPPPYTPAQVRHRLYKLGTSREREQDFRDWVTRQSQPMIPPQLELHEDVTEIVVEPDGQRYAYQCDRWTAIW